MQYSMEITYRPRIWTKRRKEYVSAELRKQGFRYLPSSKKWARDSSARDKKYEKELKSFCRKNHLLFQVRNIMFERGNNYRAEYFKNNPPARHGKYYCIYCGGLLDKEYIQVDHIIPVNKAKKKKWVQMLIRILGWESVNDIRNLGASGRECNLKKSDKMGTWVIRGMIGKSNLFQEIRWMMRLVFIIALNFYGWYEMYHNGYLEQLQTMIH